MTNTHAQARAQAIHDSVELFVPTVTKLLDAAIAHKSVSLNWDEVACLATYFMVEAENRTKGKARSCHLTQ